MSENATVAVIMGSKSDFDTVKGALSVFEDFEIPYTVRVMSAHRTPDEAAEFSKNAESNGFDAIICAAGMAAHLPGVIAASTPLPVIGVPINSTLDGMDALLAIVQMPPGIPVATVGINGALNAAILAIQMLSLNDENIAAKFKTYKAALAQKIVKANEELAKIEYKFKTN